MFVRQYQQNETRLQLMPMFSNFEERYLNF